MTRGVRSRPLIEPEPTVYSDLQPMDAEVDDWPSDVSAKSPVTSEAFKAHQWQPGQSGNPNGRPKTWKAALKEAIDPHELANRIRQDAERDDTIGADTRKWVFEQFEGKARQAVEIDATDESKSLWSQVIGAIADANRPLLPPSE